MLPGHASRELKQKGKSAPGYRLRKLIPWRLWANSALKRLQDGERKGSLVNASLATPGDLAKAPGDSAGLHVCRGRACCRKDSPVLLDGAGRWAQRMLCFRIKFNSQLGLIIPRVSRQGGLPAGTFAFLCQEWEGGTQTSYLHFLRKASIKTCYVIIHDHWVPWHYHQLRRTGSEQNDISAKGHPRLTNGANPGGGELASSRN